jgi:RHS repeat-associated protein
MAGTSAVAGGIFNSVNFNLYHYDGNNALRYLDPKFSMWISTDPALGDYVLKTSMGEGGIYNPVNLNLYHYASNNPVKYTDPDRRILANVVTGVVGAAVGAAVGTLSCKGNAFYILNKCIFFAKSHYALVT